MIFLKNFSACSQNCIKCTQNSNYITICNQCIEGYNINQNNECEKNQSLNLQYILNNSYRELGKIIIESHS